MSTDVAILQQASDQLAQYRRGGGLNSTLTQGVGGGMILPMLRMQGKSFVFVQGKDDKEELDERSLDVIIVAAGPIAKKFYKSKYIPGKDATAPDCTSATGVRPDSTIKNPVSATCAKCPNHAWGSAISEAGKETRACSDYRRMVVLRGKTLARMDVPAASLKPLAQYAKKLDQFDCDVDMVVTKIGFNKEVEYGQFTFTAVKILTPEQIEAVRDMVEQDSRVEDAITQEVVQIDNDNVDIPEPEDKPKKTPAKKAPAKKAPAKEEEPEDNELPVDEDEEEETPAPKRAPAKKKAPAKKAPVEEEPDDEEEEEDPDKETVKDLSDEELDDELDDLFNNIKG